VKWVAEGIFLLCLLGTACGVKTPLIYPDQDLPKAVIGFEIFVRGGQVLFTWSAPDAKRRARIVGYKIFYEDVLAARERGCASCRFRDLVFVDLDREGNKWIRDGRVEVRLPVDPAWFGRLYSYVVVPVSRKGFAGMESEEIGVAWMPPPPPPTKMIAKPGDHRVELQWTFAAGTPLRFNVYRRLAGEPFPLHPLNPSPVETGRYQDEAVDNGVSYFYTVRSVASDVAPWIESTAGPEVKVIPVDRVAPAPPVGLEAIPGVGLVRIFWEENREEDLAGYRVYRRTSGQQKAVLLGKVPKPATTFTDHKIKVGESYEYFVTAYDNAPESNESAPSKVVRLKIFR
jgi:hypothetical protein